MLQLIPRHVFDHIVDTHIWKGPKPRKFSYWSHLVVMIYAQLSGRKSLRDLVFSLGQQVAKLYHLGINQVKRSTLADANEQRPAIIFEKTYYKLLSRLNAETARQIRRRRFKILDASFIPLCSSLFRWADFQGTKGAVKVHVLLEPDPGLPQHLTITGGKVHELEVARQLKFAPGDLLVMDRGYVDLAWLYSLHCQGIGFVTRLPGHIRYQVEQELKTLVDSPVQRDQRIKLATARSSGNYPETLRLVHYQDPETAKEYLFLTNLLDFPAPHIADLYRQRWQIEIFFKWIKQNLKLKAFFGTSQNAVLIQIWTAMIAYLLILWAKLQSRVGWSILEMTRLVQTMIMERRNLWDILCPRPHKHPLDYGQLTLFNLCAGH